MLVSFTFESKGQTITNPKMDETGRFEVIPRDWYGINNEGFKHCAINNVIVTLRANEFNQILEEIK